uniref:Uncharacterized protein n=1 Tax=Bosea sp. NBC_00436 TaxID=2969620 RepID=A0A9E8CKE5_9HYPH
MTDRWHILAAKAASISKRPGLTNWQFGALMEKVAEQHDGVVVREATYQETRQFHDADLFQRFHWAVALHENAGFSAKMLARPGIEINFWTDKEMDPTLRAIAADPERYKHSMYTDIGDRTEVRWRYFRSNLKLADGRKFAFAWSTERNVAGYFLSWRQIVSPYGHFLVSDRDDIVASKLRKDGKALALQRSQ